MFAKRSPTLFATSLISLLLGVAASAQEALTPEEITAAWLASPHADGSAEAFSHWNAEGEIPGDCAVCHSDTGVLAFAEGGGGPVMLDHSVAIGGVVGCDVCHAPASQALDTIVFPSGVAVEDTTPSAICAVCHQGRASTDTLQTTLDGLEADVPSSDLAFVNVHYRAAAATLMGGIVRGGYQYEGHDYAGRLVHPAPADTCTGCHDPHALTVEADTCATCHSGATAPTDIRTRVADIDGDGDVTEGVAREIATLHERLLGAIGQYGREIAGAPIAHSPDQYPYFFLDTNNDGLAGSDEAAMPNRYTAWTPRLLRAAYNYQFVAKDPGAYAHNPTYVMQLLVDSLTDLGAQVPLETSDLIRP